MLHESDIGKLQEMDWGCDYAQNLWAEDVTQLATSFGDVNGNLIAYVLEGIPKLLRDHLDTDYDSWPAFVAAVQAVSPTRLQAEQQRQKDNDG